MIWQEIWKSTIPFFVVVSLQQFGKILDVEIIFNERGSKVHVLSAISEWLNFTFL